VEEVRGKVGAPPFMKKGRENEDFRHYRTEAKWMANNPFTSVAVFESVTRYLLRIPDDFYTVKTLGIISCKFGG
jgi:hypothetical protein